MRKNTRIYLAALALFVVGLALLIRTGLSEGSSYHLDVAEALAMPEQDLKGVRIFGLVSPDGLLRDANALGVRFFLQDQHVPQTVMTRGR